MHGLWVKAYQEHPSPSPLRTFVLSLQRINWKFLWRTVQGTGVWRLIAVSPVDTLSFSKWIILPRMFSLPCSGVHHVNEPRGFLRTFQRCTDIFTCVWEWKHKCIQKLLLLLVSIVCFVEQISRTQNRPEGETLLNLKTLVLSGLNTLYSV